ARRISTGRRTALDGANDGFQSSDRWISVTRVDVSSYLTAENLVDLIHGLVCVSRAGVDRRRRWLARRRCASFTGMNQLRRDIKIVFIVRHYSVQNLSLKYLSPPSQRIVTTTEPGGRRRATESAAKTFAPELTPTNKPSSRAKRRVIAWASSVATSTVSSASFGSKIPGILEVGKCFNPSRPCIGESGSIEIARTEGFNSFNFRTTPVKVPHVPRPATK